MNGQTKWVAGAAAGAMLAVMLMGAAPLSERMIGDEVLVSGADFNAVLQERAGYAFTLGHYVGKHQALKEELVWWQGMVADLAGIGTSPGVASPLEAALQERLGYQVATGHLAGVKRGLGQTVVGYQVVLADQIDQNKALRQRMLGLEYMLAQQIDRPTS
ncbi:MAG: hypothetical protein HZA24_09265 [Nitrospirae bacterium]|nr:hypothetical protein [Nitrospirota bacterium]